MDDRDTATAIDQQLADAVAVLIAQCHDARVAHQAVAAAVATAAHAADRKATLTERIGINRLRSRLAEDDRDRSVALDRHIRPPITVDVTGPGHRAGQPRALDHEPAKPKTLRQTTETIGEHNVYRAASPRRREADSDILKPIAVDIADRADRGPRRRMGLRVPRREVDMLVALVAKRISCHAPRTSGRRAQTQQRESRNDAADNLTHAPHLKSSASRARH